MGELMESHAGKASGVTNTGTTLLLPTAGSRTNRGVTNGHEVPSEQNFGDG